MGKKTGLAISRREFARRAAFVSAAASLSPSNLLSVETGAASAPAQQAASAPKLSPASQSEVDSRIQAILSQYGTRLSEAQKSDIRRLATDAQAPLDRLRAFPTTNGDGPALYLKPLVEREKKSVPKTVPAKPATAPKNS